MHKFDPILQYVFILEKYSLQFTTHARINENEKKKRVENWFSQGKSPLVRCGKTRETEIGIAKE